MQLPTLESTLGRVADETYNSGLDLAPGDIADTAQHHYSGLEDTLGKVTDTTQQVPTISRGKAQSSRLSSFTQMMPRARSRSVGRDTHENYYASIAQRRKKRRMYSETAQDLPNQIILSLPPVFRAEEEDIISLVVEAPSPDPGSPVVESDLPSHLFTMPSSNQHKFLSPHPHTPYFPPIQPSNVVAWPPYYPSKQRNMVPSSPRLDKDVVVEGIFSHPSGALDLVKQLRE
ncbi:hypothetical protein BDN72DRAFT_907249 [Pluteus cervinus]|uniref:Uncharacterized protein n=1 Tax=Pluteus cervinus TaxID=181527 RepID=A0ACD2ZX99_9AGAR|nr:hypothetical protein BDN72DRAFT_907249 [Pluteus cervinus]